MRLSRMYIFVAISLAVLIWSCCSIDSAVVTLWGGSTTVPKLIQLEVASSSTLRVFFSEPVQVRSAEIRSADGSIIQGAAAEYIPPDPASGAWHEVRFSVETGLASGGSYFLAGIVAGPSGNSLSFAVPFTGFNDRVPRLILNEIRCDYDKPKVEFIEIVAFTAGNLAGVRLLNTANTSDPFYEFPAIEVAAGEFIVYHFRSLEDGLVNELGDDLAASAGTEALPTARDLWGTAVRAPLRKTNVILLEERKGGALLDAFVGCESDKPEWPTVLLAEAASRAVREGAWGPDASTASAVVTTGTSPTRTLGRSEISADTNRAADWKIAPTGKASPGKANIPH